MANNACRLVFCSNCRKSMKAGGRHWQRNKTNYCGRECQIDGMYNRSGRYITEHGYVIVRIPKNYPHLSVARQKNGWAYEHILKATSALGRALRTGEVVHHIDCNKANNENSNLMVCTDSYHRWLHNEMSRRWAREHCSGKVG